MIYLVRHGQTDWNKLRIFNGSTETELNNTGILQSQKLKEDLKDIHIDICFSSPQKRALQTREIIFDGIYYIDNRLAEIECGEFEGKEEIKETFEAFWKASRTGEMGTERFNHFLNRTCEFCDMIVNEYKDSNVLIVTHAANARVFNYYFSGKPKDYDFLKPVSNSSGVTVFKT